MLTRTVVGIVFCYAGVAKLSELWVFAYVVDSYRIVPGAACNAIAILIPGLEVLCGLLVLTGAWSRSASIVLLTLLVTFVAAHATGLVRGMVVVCGCAVDELIGDTGQSGVLILDGILALCCVRIACGGRPAPCMGRSALLGLARGRLWRRREVPRNT